MQAGGLRYFARSLDRQWFKAEQWLPMSRHETSCCTLSEKTLPPRHPQTRAQQDCAPTRSVTLPRMRHRCFVLRMPTRRTSALHAHRCAQTGHTYFVTCCTQRRQPGLTQPNLAPALLAHCAACDTTGDVCTLACTIMPDHVHWLFTQGERLSLGRIIARWKTQTRALLAEANLHWQRDFFEHQLRPGESPEDYGLYLFLNPYRAGILPPEKPWPYWSAPHPEAFGFTAWLTPENTPPPAWLADRAPTNLATGEP